MGDRRQKTEDGRQETEDGRQETEDRSQKKADRRYQYNSLASNLENFALVAASDPPTSGRNPRT